MAAPDFQRGTASDAPPQGETQQNNEGLAQARQLAKMGLNQLQNMYSDKKINLKQYEAATSAMFDQQMLEPQIANQLQQGNTGMATQGMGQLAHDVQYEQGQMSGPQGAQGDVPAPAAGPPTGTTFGPGPTMPPPSGDDQMMLGPSSRPNESIFAGSGVSGMTQPPQDMHQWLPALVEAAQNATGPEAQNLRMFVRVLQQMLTTGS